MKAMYYVVIAAQLTALILSLTLHELAHGLMALRLGDTTARDRGRLTLNPLAHIDPFATLALPALLILFHSPVVFAAAKPVPFNPWAVRGGRKGAALVALAGPLTNLLLAVFFAIFLRLLPPSQTSVLFLGSLVLVNLSLFVFNMIPFPPLDGSRLLYAFAPESVREIMDRIEQSGFVVLLAVMLLGYRFVAPLVGAVVFSLAGTLLSWPILNSLLSLLTVGQLP
jgi:Zn-dependent protease